MLDVVDILQIYYLKSEINICEHQRRIQNSLKHLRWNFYSKIVNAWKPLTIFTESSILHIWQITEYPSEHSLLGRKK